MSKKILAMLMAVAMAFSLLPVTALAGNGTQTPANATQPRTSVTADTEDGVHISKKVEEAADGNYNLVMEAYVEGNTEIVASSRPLDIVLVLDVSGSMDDPMGNRDNTKRIDALKSAVNTFIDKVAEKNTSTDGTAVGHRISIVKFAGNQSTKIGNDTYEESGFLYTHTYNYSQIVKNLTIVNDAGKKELIDAVNDLQPAGATRADYGMQLAQSVLSSNQDSNRDKVVVMFTDGTPTSGEDFESSVASGAISASKALKDKDVKVYTIGIFSGANPKADVTKKKTSAENKYMHAMSSNYPDATLTSTQTGFLGSTEWHWNFGTRAQGSNYYLSAKNSTELNNVFQTISNSITTTQVKAGTSAVLQDTLTKQFVLNDDVNDITVQTAAVTGKDTDGEYIWAEEPEDVDGITKSVSGKTVSVTGFDYTSKDNVITKTGEVYSGHKLIVTIPIKVDEAYEGWQAGTKNYDTNTTGDNNKAGLTNYKKGEEEASTLLDTSPQVPVTAYTVTYNWGQNAPAGENIPTNSNTYLAGKTYPVDTTYAKGKEITDSDGGTWHFSGWTDSNNGVMGTNDVTITGSWTYTDPTPPASTYTLTYDANGGQFGSDNTKTETIDTAGNHALNYTSDYTPTYTSEGKKIVFLGWSAEKLNVLSSADNAAENANKIITSVNVTADGATVYAVWSLDEDGNKIPDVFEATVTYQIQHGYWFDAGTDGPVSTAPVTAQFTLYKKSGNQWVAQNPTLGNTIPTGRGGDEGYTADGWYKNSETTATSIDAQTLVTGDVTYTFKYVKTSTEATWDVSRSKTATNLDGNYESKVTLSLPSAEEKLVSDVVFVMDGSSSDNQNVVEESLKLLEDLQKAIKQSDAAVNVCIVKFKRQAFKSEWYNLSTDFNAIKIAMEKDYSGGTNIHAGLLAGKEALEEHTKVSANRKYLILVSDGSTYLYSKDGDWANDKPFTRSYYTKENYKSAAGGFWDNGMYEPNNYPEVNVPRPKTTSDVAAWKAYLKDVEERNAESNGNDYDYHCNYDLNFNQGKPSADFKSQPCVERSANNRDMAFYYADQTWQTMKKGGYHLFSIAVKDDSAGAGNADDSRSFMNYLNDGASLKFSNIKNDIFYAVSTGSTVIDTIGEKFTFGGVDSFTLKVGTKEIEGVKDASDANTVNFGDQKSNGKYQYTVTYTPDTKTFVWTINENVSNFAPVQLTYTVKLTKPETAAGTYGVTDLNGDEKVDDTGAAVDKTKALYTNQEAKLVPKDSNGNTGVEQTFPKPSVSYTVSSGNSGSHSGGSRPSLNTKDHYGYIIGYPVDYYTGQPTTDQTKKPVRPEGKITRAEVATIYFRMLTDESRTKFWSQSNSYSDVKAGDWFNNAVSTLSNAGIIAGYEDGSFRPNGYITRAEFATIAARFFDVTYNGKDLFPDISGHWAKDYINQAANKGFVNGYEDGTFKPDRNITRAEAVTLVNRTLDRHPDKNHFTKDMLVWPDNMDQTKWYYADMQEATNSHTYQMKENSDKTKYENWTKTLPIRNWEALEKAWSNANSSQGNGNVV